MQKAETMPVATRKKGNQYSEKKKESRQCLSVLKQIALVHDQIICNYFYSSRNSWNHSSSSRDEIFHIVSQWDECDDYWYTNREYHYHNKKEKKDEKT